jgi:excisionase family DNA binding protein
VSTAPHNPHRRLPLPTAQRQPLDAQTPAAPPPTGEGNQLLYTPTEAAAQLRIRESWLRRRAAARQIPCTFLGKHLRFSPTDLAAIITNSARPATGRRPRRRGAPTLRDRDLPPGPNQSVHAPHTNDHIRDGSSTWPG